MDKEKWIDGIMQSLEGSKRALPSEDLLRKIEQGIASPETKIIPLSRIRAVAAAAVVLLFLNAYTFSRYAQNNKTEHSDLLLENDAYSLLYDYEIYQ